MLERKSLDVLRLLVERAPHVVSKAEIFAHVWKDVVVTDNALTRIVAQLRKALDDDPKSPRYIETVATRGYRFVAAVTRPSAWETVAETAAVQTASHQAVRPSKSLAATAVAATGILLVVAAGWFWRGAARSSGPTAGAAFPDATTLAALRPVALSSANGFSGFPAFSPDGNSFAFSSDESGALEIYVRGLAPGSAAMRLTNNGRQNVQPAWSPDGQFVAFHEMSGQGIWVVPARGGTSRKISEFGSRPLWSPDGRTLAFQSWPLTEVNSPSLGGVVSTIWIADAEGREPAKQLTSEGQPPGPHGVAAWSPDGASILFGVGIAPKDTYWGRHVLWKVNIATKRVEPVSDAAGLTGDLALSPGGRHAIFPAQSAPGLWSLAFTPSGTADGAPKPTGIPIMGAMISSAALSADGKRLGWTAVEMSNNLWAVDIDPATGASRGDPVALTSETAARAGFPVVARDGRIACMGTAPGGGLRIYLAHAGAQSRELTTDAPNHATPFWMPGDKEIGMMTDHGDGPGFWAVDPETRRERPLFKLSAIEQPSGVEPFNVSPGIASSVSADFEKLALAYVRKGVPNIWVVKIGKSGPVGSPAQVTFEQEGGSFPSWSPDGRLIAYQCTDGGNTHVCTVSSEGGDRRQLTREPGQSWLRGWSPDGDKVLFAARRGLTWNVAWVSRSTGTTRALTQFTKPNTYVRYPVWDAAGKRVIFERSETRARIWSVEVPAIP